MSPRNHKPLDARSGPLADDLERALRIQPEHSARTARIRHAKRRITERKKKQEGCRFPLASARVWCHYIDMDGAKVELFETVDGELVLSDRFENLSEAYAALTDCYTPDAVTMTDAVAAELRIDGAPVHGPVYVDAEWVAAREHAYAAYEARLLAKYDAMLARGERIGR